MVFHRLLCYVFLIISSNSLLAAMIVPDYSVTVYDKEIVALYKKAPKNNDNRLTFFTQYFLGRPYLLGALGEGKAGFFDEEPVYRTDAFDCLTYVSMILALTESNNLAEFQKNIRKIQYKNGIPTFVNRLHFTEVDWNVENTKNGFIQDITHTLGPTKIAHTVINKPAWYRKMTADNLRLLTQLTPEQEEKRVLLLQKLAEKVIVIDSDMPYLPLSLLFDSQGNPNQTLFDQIPSGSIIEIVRPNWDLEKIIGTNLNVSHLGFAIRTSSGLMFFEASSLENRVIAIPLADYLKTYLNSPTVKGINVQKVITPILTALTKHEKLKL